MSIRTKMPMPLGAPNDPRERASRQRRGRSRPERRQLDRHVGVEPLGRDRVEHALVLGRRRLSLLRRPDELAQDVDGRHDAPVVQAPDGGDGVRRASRPPCTGRRNGARPGAARAGSVAAISRSNGPITRAPPRSPQGRRRRARRRRRRRRGESAGQVRRVAGAGDESPSPARRRPRGSALSGGSRCVMRREDVQRSPPAPPRRRRSGRDTRASPPAGRPPRPRAPRPPPNGIRGVRSAGRPAAPRSSAASRTPLQLLCRHRARDLLGPLRQRQQRHGVADEHAGR